MKRIMIFICVAVCLAGMVSCSERDAGTDGLEVMRIVAAPEDNTDYSRSILPEDSAYEDYISGITLAVYDADTGFLVGCAYEDSGELEISLPKNRMYRFCLLANMGDQTDNVADEIRDMESFRYDVINYSKINQMGLPMVCNVVAPWKPEMILNLRRLMAKIVITVDKNDIADMGGGGHASFRNNKVSVNRVARVLYPFAPEGSAAKTHEDLFDSEDIEYDTFEDGMTSNSEKLVLYVPENMQGIKLPENIEPGNKSDSNEELTGEEFCTYVSLDGYKNGSTDGVYGSLTYRFFPGADNVTSFDLVGGKCYNVALVLTWNGMYTEGDWRVERSGWSDNRRISVSLEPDGSYSTERLLPLAIGSSDVPVYIYYSPQGEPYESWIGGGDSHHYDNGWMFCPDKPFDSSGEPCWRKENTGEFSGDLMSTGFVEHQAFRTVHYVSIPSGSEVGYSNVIRYMTWDRRVGAALEINVTEPVINFTPSSMLFLFHECGHESGRIIRIDSSSPVRPCNITAYTDDIDLITLGHFNQEDGTVHVYWNETNTSSVPKIAEVYLHSESCGVTAVCTLVQQNRPGLSIEDEEYAGNGVVEY